MNYQNSPIPSSMQPQGAGQMSQLPPGGLDLGHYLDILRANKWLIAGVTALVLLVGLAVAFLTRPVYESNILIQVEEPQEGPNINRSILAEAGSLFSIKTAASAEMEIINSRTVIGEAVDDAKMDIDSHPHYAPVLGYWLARRATALSDPGFLGMSGYVSGTERITVDRMDVPAALLGERITVEALGDQRYRIKHKHLTEPLEGKVGALLEAQTLDGPLALQIGQLEGKPGAEFDVIRYSRLSTISSLQKNLTLVERGKQSGVISVSLREHDPVKLARTLNTIGVQYVQQNVQRKSAEAEKTLRFLDVQLPVYKRQLEASEEIYNRFRNQKGTIALEEEAKLILGQAVERQTQLLEAQQRRREQAGRFTSEHPAMQTLDAQIGALQREIGDIQKRIKALPSVQQEAVRMERDLKVNTTLYQQLLDSALQMRLVKEGKVGNARVLDPAAVAEEPISPKRGRIVAIALVLGLFLGIVAAFVRNLFVEEGVSDPYDVEAEVGLPVFASIPRSGAQRAIAARGEQGAGGARLLALDHPDDPAVESLRSLRTSMQAALPKASNNRFLIASPTPGVGRSFVAANFAALMASAGKRTLLVDADFRRGHLHQYMGVQRGDGLADVVLGRVAAQQAVHRHVVNNLDFVAAGEPPGNPAEMLVSEAFQSALEQLSSAYDLVVISAPPVLVASDAGTLAAQAGTVLLVARAQKSTMGELNEAARRLAMSGRAATGVLVNGLDLSKRSYGTSRDGRYRYAQYSYDKA